MIILSQTTNGLHINITTMKKYFTFLLLLLAFQSISQTYPVTGITISLLANPDANTANWATGASMFTITATTRLDNGRIDNRLSESVILTTIKKGGAKVCGTYTANSAPSANFNGLNKVWSGSSAVALLGKDCTLPPGDYELCVQFFGKGPAGVTTLSEEKCRTFSIRGNEQAADQSLHLLAPANGTVFSEADSRKPIMFRWRAMVSGPQAGAISYHLRVYEISGNENAVQAIANNRVVIDRTVRSINSSAELLPGNTNTKKFAWTVDAELKDAANGKILRSAESWMFSIESPERRDEPVGDTTTPEKTIEVNDTGIPNLNDTLPEQGCVYSKFIRLLAPSNNYPLKLKPNGSITFSWTDVKSRVPKGYGYKLSVYSVSGEGNAIIFETVTDKNSFEWKADQLKDIGKTPRAFRWRIALIDKELNAICPDQQHGQFSVMSASNNELSFSVGDLQINCVQPGAYDANGNINYTISFKVTDNNSKCNNLPINPQLDPTAPHPLGYLLYIQGITTPIPIVFNPGFGVQNLTNSGSYTAQGTFSVPANTPALVQATILVFYKNACTINGNTFDLAEFDDAAIALPDCVCNVCKEWTLKAEKNNIIIHKNTGTVGYDVLEFNGSLSASPGPITEVKVEIVAFNTYIKSSTPDDCKQLNDVSSYTHGTILGTSPNSLASPGNWAAGQLTSNINNTGRQIKWISNVGTGVNMASPKPLRLFIGIPNFISNDCCKPVYDFCLRIFYRDADCRVCEKLLCFSAGSTQYTVTN